MNPNASDDTPNPYPIVNAGPTAGTNPWSTGLFNCLDDADGCIEGTFCGPCQRSRQYNTLNNNLNSVHYPTLFGPLFVDMCIGVPVAQIAMTFHLRQEVRRRYKLEGNDFQDALASVCCTDLVTCQNYREMAARGEWTSGFCANPPIAAHTPIPVIMGSEAVEGEVVEMKLASDKSSP